MKSCCNLYIEDRHEPNCPIVLASENNIYNWFKILQELKEIQKELECLKLC